MDPKVCGKLLTLHRRGYGVDVEALHDPFPLRRSTAVAVGQWAAAAWLRRGGGGRRQGEAAAAGG